MKAKYIGDPNDGFSGPNAIVAHGLTFEKGKPVEVDGRTAEAKKLKGNTHFEVLDEKGKK